VVIVNPKMKGHAKQASAQYEDNGSFDLTPAQISQLNQLSQNHNRMVEERMLNDQNQMDRISNQKAKRKHNLSQQMHNQNPNARNSMLLAENNTEIILNAGTYDTLKQNPSLIQTNYPLNDSAKNIASKRSDGDSSKHRQKHVKNQSMVGHQFDSGRV
jgi:hypothetical protein